jgi:hypothetical protein
MKKNYLCKVALSPLASRETIRSASNAPTVLKRLKTLSVRFTKVFIHGQLAALLYTA